MADKAPSYKINTIKTSRTSEPEDSILIIYTGGTLGMTKGDNDVLKPFNFGNIMEAVPALNHFNLRVTIISFPKPIDSSDINIDHWKDLAYIIQENYHQYIGFIVLHGTDTMAFTASAMSFMLEGLNKPVIFTGSQLPLGGARSDARENIVTAIEIASTRDDLGYPMVPEVAIYFNNILIRGNRATKVRSSDFSAFESENYPALARAGVVIDYNRPYIKPFIPHKSMLAFRDLEPQVALLKIFPGITREQIQAIAQIKTMKGLVIESFGSGNVMTYDWFLQALSTLNDRGVIIVNVSQCLGGKVIQGRYANSEVLNEIGIHSGGDMTTEAALTKLMYLLGKEKDTQEIRKRVISPLRGEMA